MVKSCPITEWSSIWMPFEYRPKFCLVFGTPFEYRTAIQMVVWIPNYHLNTGHLNTGKVKVRYSDVSVIQMFVIQIPIVKVCYSGVSLIQMFVIQIPIAQLILCTALFGEPNTVVHPRLSMVSNFGHPKLILCANC